METLSPGTHDSRLTNDFSFISGEGQAFFCHVSCNSNINGSKSSHMCCIE